MLPGILDGMTAVSESSPSTVTREDGSSFAFSAAKLVSSGQCKVAPDPGCLDSTNGTKVETMLQGSVGTNRTNNSMY